VPADTKLRHSQAPRKPIRARAARASAATSKPASTSTPATPPKKSILKGDTLTNRPHIPSSSLFSKKDKRAVKHTHLLNRLSSSKAVSSRISKPLKRSRKPKALSGGNLSSLAAALPDSTEDNGLGNKGNSTSEIKRVLLGASLKSKSGVQKRREEVAKLERERMKGNMGVMSSAAAGQSTLPGQDKDTQAGGSTWAALRAHIAQSMAVQK